MNKQLCGEVPQPKNWLSHIDDTKPLSELTIPGTHDSATYKTSWITGFGYVKCQSLSFEEQFNAGCRFLDIRCRLYQNALVCHHSSYYMHLNFDDVINACQSFLNAHPTETVIMCLKEEYKQEQSTITWVEAVRTYIEKNPSLWHLENEVPILGKVRGKIVLARRFYCGRKMGINASFRDNRTFSFTFRWNPTPQKLICEDRYNPGTLVEKQRLITANITDAESHNDANNFYWTFSSGYITLWYTPKGMAAALNPWLKKTIVNNGKQKGLVIVDFLDEDLGKHLVSLNFPPTDGYHGKSWW